MHRAHRFAFLSALAFATIAVAVPGLVAAVCVPGPSTLCIDDASGDKRFEVKVTYSTTLGGGRSGDGKAIPMSTLGINRGGLFWFFSADNPEMQIKILNGCSINQHFWVYLAAGTNVGFTVTVTDTPHGNVKTYANTDLTPAAPVQDIDAFNCDGSVDPPEEPWLLTTRPGTFFVPSAQKPVERISIPVAPNDSFYKIVVEVEVDLHGWYSARPSGKHNLWRIQRGTEINGNLFGDLGLRGPDTNSIELVSNADLPPGQWEVTTGDLALDPNGTYSFLFAYTASIGETEIDVYEGSVVGVDRIFRMFGSATANNPIRPVGSGFTITFGNPDQGGGNDDVPTFGWVYKNLKVYLERRLP